MFKRILVPIDGSATSNKALDLALQIARENDASVRLVHSFDELAYLATFEVLPPLIEEARRYADEILGDGLKLATNHRVRADARVLEVPGRRLGDLVAEAAKDFRADLI